MTASFDFDGTLTRNDVQEYAIQLIGKGIEVSITSRRNRFQTKEVYEMAKELGIEKVRLTSGDNKCFFLVGTDVHIDNDPEEIREIERYSEGCEAVCVEDDDWIEKCNKILF